MDQLLKMQWLSDLIAIFIDALGLDASSRWGGTLHFFIYDTIKIVILLCVMIFIISYIQSYFPPERSKRILGRFKGFSGNVVGALLGTVTPFCACSSIPLFIAFTRAGLPLGVTFSFLISSPMVDIASIVLIMSIFGPHVAFIYTIVGLIIAVVGGSIIQKLKMSDQVADFVRGEPLDAAQVQSLKKKQRISYALGQTGETFRKVFPFILIGVSIGALIHNWIPQEIIEAILGDGNPFAVVLATLVGAPIYADIFGTIPIAEGCRPWHHTRFYDERYRTVDSIAHHAFTRGQAEVACYIHWSLSRRNDHKRLCVQLATAPVRVKETAMCRCKRRYRCRSV